LKKDHMQMKHIPLLVILFFILIQWLKPLPMATDMYRIDVFIIFIGVCLVGSWLGIRKLISIPLKSMLLILLLHTASSHVYGESSWLNGFLHDVAADFGHLFTGEWKNWTPIVRTLLFFILLWVSCSLSYRWVVQKQKGLLFLLILSIVYLAIFDTFSPYYAKQSVIGVTALGFITIGLQNTARITSLFKGYPIFHVQLLAAITCCILIGYFAPKLAPQWPDPISGFTSLTSAKSEGTAKVGYSTDDSRLGGPFLPDDTPVFSVITANSSYWRVEVKDFYTGKGWENSDRSEAQLDVGIVDTPSQFVNNAMNWYGPLTKTEPARASFNLNGLPPYFIYPAGLISIEAPIEWPLDIDRVSEKIPIPPSTVVDSYKTNFSVPEFPIEGLKSVNSPDELENTPYFKNMYTQLPAQLPQRVKDLSLTLTADKANRYDKVKAIENYFADFTYEMKDVPYPQENQDYVDQFLFETQKGYCNNFSSAMIVLLRAADIPSRWVKGYTEGEKTSGTAETNYEDIYQVTNNNAHSWVEVYFPGYGWVPFEPTKGFTNPYRFTQEVVAAPQTTSETIDPIAKPAEKPQKDFSEEVTGTTTQKPIIQWTWKTSIMIVVFVLIVAALSIKHRLRLLSLFLQLRYRNMNEKNFASAYHALVKQLGRIGLPHKKTQTLREYALYVDEHLRSSYMQKLTDIYEQITYSQREIHIPAQIKQHWVSVLKQTTSPIKKDLDKA
jgi:transglutaminase-like putative cysteine protease